jgi:hypothetical protein
VALGRAIAAQMQEGLRLVNCDAIRFSTCRMYRSFAEVWEGFTKNVRSAFESSVLGFIFAGAFQISLFLLPFLFLFLHPAHRGVIVSQIALIFAIRALLAARFRTSWSSVLLHPIGHLLALAIGLNSWRLTGRRGVIWKGRRYGDKPPGRLMQIGGGFSPAKLTARRRQFQSKAIRELTRSESCISQNSPHPPVPVTRGAMLHATPAFNESCDYSRNLHSPDRDRILPRLDLHDHHGLQLPAAQR